MAAPPAHAPYVASGASIDMTFDATVARTRRHAAAAAPAAAPAAHDNGTCNLCFRPDFLMGDEFGDRTMILCDSCEREYHVGCLRAGGTCDLTEVPQGDFYCSEACKRVRDAVHGAPLPKKIARQRECACAPTPGRYESGFRGLRDATAPAQSETARRPAPASARRARRRAHRASLRWRVVNAVLLPW